MTRPSATSTWRPRTPPPESVAAWLRVAARRLSGSLVYRNWKDDDDDGEEEDGEGGAFELPCLQNATAVSLNLGFLLLAVPPAGVFARLIELSLSCIRFQGPCDLGDAISSRRCPSLQKLRVNVVHGLHDLHIHSESLLEVELQYLYWLGQLNLVALALKRLNLHNCLSQNQQVSDISAPQLVFLEWRDWYHPSSVQLGKMTQLKLLLTGPFLVYGAHNSRNNRAIVGLLKQFQVIHSLRITLLYRKVIGNFQYWMEDITMLPHITFLNLLVINKGHTFGASLFHVLRLCTGITRLLLRTDSDLEAQPTCPSGCICDQLMDWKTEELTLNCLQEAEATDLKGAEHEVAFMKRLFNWARVLKKMRITFNYSISESKATELCQTLSSFSRPETCVEFHMHPNVSKDSVQLLAPQD